MAIDIEWRTVQFFLHPETGVCEVSLDVLWPNKMRCNCAVFLKKAKCRHVDFVRAKQEANGGQYPVKVPEDIEEEEIERAFEDTESFREFVIRYGKPEVL